jgi:NTE family protein
MQYIDNILNSHGRIGLAFGSGSTRGWSHIGVIRALEEAGITVDYIAGTSIGALVGAVYASGKIDSLEDAVYQFSRKHVFSFRDLILPKSGLIDGVRITNFIQQYVLDEPIEKLPVPLAIIATDLNTGDEVVLREGSIVEAIRASISLPGIFKPVRKDDYLLVDGGLVNPVPVRTVRDMGADFVIAVDLNCDIVQKGRHELLSTVDNSENLHKGEQEERTTGGNKTNYLLNGKLREINMAAAGKIRQLIARDPQPNIIEVMMTSIKIMESQITTVNLKTDPPDVLIQPRLGHINLMEFQRAEESILEGYRVARSQLAAWQKKNSK